MAGDHTGDQSFYDFLIEEPEMIAPAPPGHFPHQQPISPPNRTSRDAPPRTDPTEIETHHHANHPATLPVLGMQLPGTLPDASRAQSRAHLDLNLNLDLHAHPQSHSHAPHISHAAHGIQNHGPGHGHGHATHPVHSSAGLPSAGFASHLPPASSSPMTLDWNIYSVPPNLQLNPSHFDFDVTGHMGVVGHSSLAHATTDPTPYAYGSNLVSPSSIHPNNAHFDTNTSTQWDDSLGHDSSTPKVRTPAHQMASNPWAEIEEPPRDNNSTTTPSRPRKTPRPRRQKKEARKLSDDSQGARSSSTGGTAHSVSDAASPSSMSQNSRTSVGSKSVSMASTASVSTASAASSRQSKLRSASRTSKNSRDKPNDTPEDRRTRASHNLVEKQYRNRLNAQFESLLSALPEQARHGDGGSGNGIGNGIGNGDNESDQANDPDRRVSKGEVLEMARKHIEALERERNQLELENLELHGNIRRLKGSNSESTTSSLGPGSSAEHDTDKDQKRDDDGDDQNENP